MCGQITLMPQICLSGDTSTQIVWWLTIWYLHQRSQRQKIRPWPAGKLDISSFEKFCNLYSLFRFCEQRFSSRQRCTSHEIDRCEAAGAPHRVCGRSCDQDCPGAMNYQPPEDRRKKNTGRPRRD